MNSRGWALRSGFACFAASWKPKLKASSKYTSQFFWSCLLNPSMTCVLHRDYPLGTKLRMSSQSKLRVVNPFIRPPVANRHSLRKEKMSANQAKTQRFLILEHGEDGLLACQSGAAFSKLAGVAPSSSQSKGGCSRAQMHRSEAQQMRVCLSFESTSLRLFLVGNQKENRRPMKEWRLSLRGGRHQASKRNINKLPSIKLFPVAMRHCF